MDICKACGIDVSTLPEKDVKVLVNVIPKVRCKNKLLQKIFVKLFGYKVIYETRRAKVLKIQPEDYKFKTGNMTIDIQSGER